MENLTDKMYRKLKMSLHVYQKIYTHYVPLRGVKLVEGIKGGGGQSEGRPFLP